MGWSLYDGSRVPPLVTVAIPTHNRLEVLPEVLDALDAQQDAPEFEVLVVDDGSTDGTDEHLAARAARHPLRWFRQENRGPAAARNRAVAEARGSRIAFLGDDTVPAPDWLAAHERAHARREGDPKLAVIGYTGWHRRIRRTPFLDYLNDRGLQFGYALIADRENVPFNFFYTSNLSLRRERLLEEPFDEGFPYPAWEDIEAAWRLTRRGLRIVYEPAATAAHDHPTDFARFAARQEKAGYCAVVFRQRHPELGDFVGIGAGGPPPLPGRRRQRLLEGLVRALLLLPVSVPRLWEEALRFHYIRGLRRGWRELIEDRRGGSP
jgi:glycosyltransferase involved in cell wall biosynthesis